MRTAALPALLTLLTLALSLSAAPAPEKKDKPQDLIVGKWSREDPKTKEKIVIEFTKDGKVVIKGTPPDKGKDLEITGVYKFITDEKVEVELSGDKKKETLKVKVTKDELTTTDARDKPETFKRVK